MEEAARLLGLSRGIAYQYVRDGVIPAQRVGRRWLIPRRRLHAWLDGKGVTQQDDRRYLAEWTDKAGQRHREHADTETAAVKLVARGQAGGLRFHDLRHSYATWLVDDGVPPNMVQRVMGHERASTTLDLYTRRTDDSTRILRALGDEDPDDGAAGAPVLA